MESNSVSNHTSDNKIGRPRSSDFVNHLYDYRPNWTPLSPITIINQAADSQLRSRIL